MNLNLNTLLIAFIIAITVPFSSLQAQRKMENLGRGVVAIRSTSTSAFISWRLLGNEPRGIGFNLYRSTAGGTAVKLNNNVLYGGTNYTDNTVDLTQVNSYFVKPVLNGTEQTASIAYTLKANAIAEPCIRIPLKPDPDHFICHTWVGDLDGDGEYEFVIGKQGTDTIATSYDLVEAYKRDGTFLWRVDLGYNSNNFGNTQFEGRPTSLGDGNWDGVTVYDMDGDGKAEVLVETADGVTFGDGKVLTNSDHDVQFISVLNGFTGAEKARVSWPDDYKSDGWMGFNYGIGYLDGIHPSLVVKGKNRQDNGNFNYICAAFDYDGTSFTQKWKWLRGDHTYYEQNLADGHQIRVVDVDGDGKDEICDIGFCLKGDGTLLYSLDGITHGDRFCIGKFDPNRPGLQGYGIQQYNPSGILEYYYDAGTGKILWQHTTINAGDEGRGVTGDLDPNSEGYESWSFTGVYNTPTNKLISTSYPYPNFRIWWDGDLLSEGFNENVDKWNVGRLLTTWKLGVTFAARSAAQFYGDILGDWREEIVMAGASGSNELLIITTPIPSDNRIYTLPHNPEYRNCMTVKGYQQSHYVDYYLGANMSTPPTPPMQTAKCVWKGNSANNVWDVTTSNWVVNNTSGQFTQGDDVMFDISGAPDTLVQLSGALSPSAIKVVTPLNVNYSFGGSGSITGSTGLLKSGRGVISINTNCNYTDTTRVEEGGVYVNSTLSQSPVWVNYGAAIGGNGTYSQPVTLSRGAIVSPGAVNGVGTLTFSKDLKFPARGTCMFDITDDSTGITKPSDKIVINGNVTVSDTMTIKVNKINGKVKPGVYPLIAHTGSFTGNLAKIGIEGLFGQKYALKDSLNTIYLRIESARSASSLEWNGSSSSWDLQTTPAWNMNGVPVTFVANDSVTFNGNGANKPNVTVSGTLNVGKITVDASSCNYSFSGTGNIGGAASLTKTGAGALSLLTTNSYTGPTSITGGKFIIGSLANAGVASSIGADTAKAPSHFVLSDAYLQYNGATTISTNKGLTLGGTNDTIDVSVSGKIIDIQGVVAGTANLIKTGAGTLNFQKSVNTFTGNAVVKGGILSLGDDVANVNGIKGSIVLDGGTFTMYSNISTSTSSNVLANNFIIPTGSTGRIETDARCFLTGTLTGGGTLNYYVDYVRTEIAGDWSGFAGTINMLTDGAADFRFNNSKGLPNARLNMQNAGNAYMLSGGTLEVGEISGISTAYLTSGRWVVGGLNTDATFNGIISGTSVTKKGTGSWMLTNANTYTGGTTINGGALIVSNATGSGTGTGAVTVYNGGKLAGTGIIGGAVTVNSGANVAPGTSTVGTLNFNSTLTLSTGSKTSILVSGTTNSKLSVTGTLTLGGTLELNNSGSYKEGDSFTLFTATSVSGQFAAISPATPGEGLQWNTTRISEGIISVDRTMGVDAVSESAISVYPNPVKGSCYVTIGALNGEVKTELYNEVGKVVSSKLSDALSGRQEIDMSNLNPGIYFVKVSSGGKSFLRKVIKL